VSDELRQDWTISRAALRCILGAYIGVPASSLEFTVGPYGKPEVVGSSLAFNASHTRGLALVAVTAGGRIGIDVERIEPGIDVEALSRRFFAPAEAEAILALRPERRIDAFYACWTRKEAFVKAVGAGLTLPLDGFRVTVQPDHAPALLSVDWDPLAPRRWRFADLSELEVAATLTVEVVDPLIRRFTWMS
jgi:4'-phosphopantetheinyl transferase